MGETPKTRSNKKNFKNPREPRNEPIFIFHDSQVMEENPLPSESPSWPDLILIGGPIVALLCAWWLMPQQMQMLWGKWLKHLFQ